MLRRGGTPDFDEEGWEKYVENHRKADPALSAKGMEQARLLAQYLIPYIEKQASHPIRIITSPMLRTLETIRPTLEGIQKLPGPQPKVAVTVCGFYHESEGCHNKGTPEEGMNPSQICELLKDGVEDTNRDIDFVGFDDPCRGWYMHGTGPETREESEIRAAKFYLWFSEYLDGQLAIQDKDLFDAGVSIQGEENEDEHDRHATRIRRRRTAIMVGHGDFMSLVLKRLIAGYGHYVETEGIPHSKFFQQIHQWTPICVSDVAFVLLQDLLSHISIRESPTLSFSAMVVFLPWESTTLLIYHLIKFRKCEAAAV